MIAHSARKPWKDLRMTVRAGLEKRDRGLPRAFDGVR